ncbi:MAG: hypothetical protein C5B60_12030 [Chloroflexi bacterium]|nr:MAG: hypothetical protein C5B60_12030 [Chloroflexota bacterium]
MIYSSAFYDHISSEAVASAKVVVPLVMNLIHPTSVVDVGCATGAWLRTFLELGVPSVLGLDSTEVEQSKLLIPSDRFRHVDLMKPFRLPDPYDLALSLEVAEHLPGPTATGFVRSLCQVAPLVLFSAAVPGQGGVQHVNEQWPEYWRRLFRTKGFRMFDPFRPLLWHDERVASWYRQNMFLFVREDLATADARFSNLSEVKDGYGLMLVDASILFGLRATLIRLPRLAWMRVSARVERYFPKRVISNDGCHESGRLAP